MSRSVYGTMRSSTGWYSVGGILVLALTTVEQPSRGSQRHSLTRCSCREVLDDVGPMFDERWSVDDEVARIIKGAEFIFQLPGTWTH